MKKSFTVQENAIGERLDVFVSNSSSVSRSQAVKWIESGFVTVNGKSAEKKLLLKIGDLVEIDEPTTNESLETKSQNIPLQIIYEDNDIIVVNKPSGMVVHPAPGNYENTLVNALLFHCGDSLSGIGGVTRPGIVHRIDKYTSGLLVVAKNDTAHKVLSDGLKVHAIKRTYFAVVLGNIKEDEGTIDEPIGRHPINRQKMAVIHNEKYKSRDAVTHYRVLARGSYKDTNYCLVRCDLETGRTHQIRVHLSFIGHPILGDSLYGGNKSVFEKYHKDLIEEQCLHAGILQLTHPINQQEMIFKADLPENLSKMISILFPEFQINY